MKKYFLALCIVFAAALAYVVIYSSNSGSTKNQQLILPAPDGKTVPSTTKQSTLTSKNWVWIRTTYNDGREVKPAKEGDFVLVLDENSHFSLKTDCNGVGGTYEANGDMIAFKEMVSTLMYCENSLESDFVRMLGDVSSYHISSDNQLILNIKFDSGSVILK